MGNQNVGAGGEGGARLADTKQFREALLRINDDATISVIAAVVDECYRAGLEKMQFFPEGGDGELVVIAPMRDATHVPIILRHCPEVDLSSYGRQLVLVDIVRDGRCFLKGGEITSLNLESYLQMLIVKVGAAHEMNVVLRPDKDVCFRNIKDILRLCVKMGIWRVFVAGDSRTTSSITPVFPVNWPRPQGGLE